MSVTSNHSFTLAKEEALPQLAKDLLALSGHRKIWLFKGEMGSGKTTFIKALCRELGVQGELSSPTFAIVNEYHTNDGKKIYHFDLYRLKKREELFDIGFEEYLDSGNYCFIEWPEISDLTGNHNMMELHILTNGEARIVEIHLT